MAKCNAYKQHCPQVQRSWRVRFICCEWVAIVWAFCNRNKWGQTDPPHGRRPSSPSERSPEPSRSARAVTEPRCLLQLSQSFWWQKAHRACQDSELRARGWEGGETHIMKGGGGVSGSKQDARTDLLMYKKILHFIRSYHKHYCLSS